MLRHMLRNIVVLLSPLSAHSLSKSPHIPKEGIDETLEDLYAILDILKGQIRLFCFASSFISRFPTQ
jgi:hypothetical protein